MWTHVVMVYLIPFQDRTVYSLESPVIRWKRQRSPHWGKTTSGNLEGPIFITKREHYKSLKDSAYWIYRVYVFDRNAKTGKIKKIKDSFKDSFKMHPTAFYRSTMLWKATGWVQISDWASHWGLIHNFCNSTFFNENEANELYFLFSRFSSSPPLPAVSW